ncbi:MAG: transposase [Armatimonadetes bacterium]|nr:transposase [Armatimonadota bacterium]
MAERARRRVFNDPGHAHELTFSTYRRKRLLEDETVCRAFLSALDAARKEHAFQVWAYVLMPDHVHLLLFPTGLEDSMAGIRQAVKQPVAKFGLATMRELADPRLQQLHDGRRPRFWQPGGGYDRNMHSSKACRKSIGYIHDNPVVAGLCAHPWDWEFSSAAAYRGDDCDFQVDFPTL